MNKITQFFLITIFSIGVMSQSEARTYVVSCNGTLHTFSESNNMAAKEKARQHCEGMYDSLLDITDPRKPALVY